MTGKPGLLQSSCAAGEIDQLLWWRHDLKFARKTLKSGLAYARNIEPAPQGGFRLAPGSEHAGAMLSGALRMNRFRNSQGVSYDVIFGENIAEVWDASAKVATVTHGFTASQVMEFDTYQRDGTLLMFHKDVETPRLKRETSGWSVDTLPYENIPRHNFGSDVNGDPYTGAAAGTASVWEITFFNAGKGSVTIDETWFTLQLSGEKTQSINLVSDTPPTGTTIDEAATATNIDTALSNLSILASGYSVAAHATLDDTIVITFSGAGNLGDRWSVTGEVVNDAEAAIVSVETTVGEGPGEPIISADRGWPATGTFYQQSMIVGGLNSLPRNWIKSVTGDPFNFDIKRTAATGAFVVPMDIEGGERIVHIRAARNLGIFTDEAEYWISESKLSKSEAPVHVQASRNGSRIGVPLTENEGSLVYVHKNGDVISEFRYTDVDGNFLSQALTVIATHLVSDVISISQRKAEGDRDGNRIGVVRGDGTMRLITILREQEVSAFARYDTGGNYKYCSVNGDNEMMVLVERKKGGAPFVNRERLLEGELLFGARKISLSPQSNIVTGLDLFEGEEVWVIANDDLFGPYTVTGAKITLPVQTGEVNVGRWTAPLVRTLPLSREIAPGLVLQKKGRVTTVKAYVIDTTSLAIAANGGKAFDVDLLKYGGVEDKGELLQPYTGWVEMTGFSGSVDDLQVEFTQVRPGRLTVAAWVIESED